MVTASVAGVILAGRHIWKDDWSQCLEPRLLLPVVNVPLVNHLLRWLRAAGVADTVICTNTGVRWLRGYAGDGSFWNLRVQYYVDRMPRGPAGCLGDAGQLVAADDYLVVEGATVPTVEARALLAHHRASRAAATLAVHIEPGGAEEPAPAGAYVFARSALLGIPRQSYQDIKETLVPQLLRAGQVVCVYPAPPAAPRITDLAGYLALQEWALRRGLRSGDAGPAGDGEATIWLHPSVRLAASARVVGPAMVDAGSFIGERALLIGPVVVGQGCRVEADALVSNSVIWDGGVVEREAQIESCVVATGAVVSSHARLRGVIQRAYVHDRLGRNAGMWA